MGTRTLKYGSELITYSVEVRPRRRTLGIEVHPDGRVVVLAPPSCSETVVAQKLRLRARWISRLLAQFSRYQQPAKPRQYLSGESHRYLGRQYRLLVVRNDWPNRPTQVKLTRGLLVVSGRKGLSREKVRSLICQWQAERARNLFNEILTYLFPPFARRGFSMPVVVVRLMKTRWGSLSSHQRVSLNPRLLQAPRACIEYVVAHELCHLAHHNHSSKFFCLLNRMMPDWKRRKEQLEQYPIY